LARYLCQKNMKSNRYVIDISIILIRWKERKYRCFWQDMTACSLDHSIIVMSEVRVVSGWLWLAVSLDCNVPYCDLNLWENLNAPAQVQLSHSKVPQKRTVYGDCFSSAEN
jgi:hypothetical protein